ncbi:E3 ubiquitin-protein ligase TRIM45-like [Glandiceps talaboti]
MATAIPDLETFLKELGEDYLSCTICLEQYKNPKVLPCDHTFCQECLIKIVERQGRLQCSVCDTPCELPNGRVSELKANFFMNSLLDIVGRCQPSDESEPGLCEGCDENTATNRCVDCSVNFCPSCTKPHRKVAVSRNHTIITLEEYKEGKLTSRLLPPKVYCNVHPENEVKYYCETCQVTMCTDCAMIKHRSEKHVHSELKEAADKYIIHLKEMVTKLRLKEKETERCKSAAKQTRDKLQVQCQEEEKKVRKKAEEMVQKIRKEEKRLVEELKTEYGQKVKTTEVQIDEWEMKHGNISSTCGYLEALMHHGSAAQLMTNQQKTMQHIGDLITMETKPNISPEVIEFKPADVVPRQSMLGLLGRRTEKGGVTTKTSTFVHTGPYRIQKSRLEPSDTGKVKPLPSEICASKCTVDKLPSKLLEGESGAIVIRTKDSQGQQVIPTPVVKIEMRKPDGTREDVKVTDNRDGTLVFTVKGEMEGRHQVTMSIGDKPIQGSPFSIPVIKRRVKTLGKKGSGKGCFNRPHSVIMNKCRQFVVADAGNRRIEVVDMVGNHIRSITFTQFNNDFTPNDVAVSDDGNYFTTDWHNKHIVVSNEDGKLIRFFGQNELKYPWGIAISPVDGTVYVTDWDGKGDDTDKTTHCIRKYTQYGKYITTVGSYGTGPAEFKGPDRLCVSRQGRLYVPDIGNHCVQVFNLDCKFLYKFGSYGEEDGDFHGPESVAVDKDEFLYVAEQRNKRVQKFDKKGQFICRIDSEEDGLVWPCSVAVTDDSPAKVVVVDYKSHCLKIFTQ